MKHGYKLYNHSDLIQQQILLKLALIIEIKKTYRLYCYKYKTKKMVLITIHF